MERAAEGNAAGGARAELEHKPRRWPPVEELDAEQTRLARLLPDDVSLYYVKQHDGRSVRWSASFSAGSPGELVERIRAAAKAAEASS